MTGVPSSARCMYAGSGGGARPVPRDESPDQEHDDRPADREQPSAEVPELREGAAQDQAAEPAAEQSANDAEQQRGEPSTSLVTGQDQLGDRPGDQAEDEKCEETHMCSFIFQGDSRNHDL